MFTFFVKSCYWILLTYFSYFIADDIDCVASNHVQKDILATTVEKELSKEEDNVASVMDAVDDVREACDGDSDIEITGFEPGVVLHTSASGESLWRENMYTSASILKLRLSGYTPYMIYHKMTGNNSVHACCNSLHCLNLKVHELTESQSRSFGLPYSS